MTKTKFTLLNNKIIEKDINGTLNESKIKVNGLLKELMYLI